MKIATTRRPPADTKRETTERNAHEPATRTPGETNQHTR